MSVFRIFFAVFPISSSKYDKFFSIKTAYQAEENRVVRHDSDFQIFPDLF